MNLFLALSISYLGAGSKEPKKRALSIFVLLLLSSVGCSILLYTTLPDLSMLTTKKTWFPLLSLTVITECVVAITYSLSASTRLAQHNKLATLISTLPLNPMHKWFYNGLPQHFALLLTLGIIVPSLYACGVMLGLSGAYCFMSIIVGICAGYGLTSFLQYLRHSIRLPSGIVFMSLLYICIRHSMDTFTYWTVGVCILIVLSMFGLYVIPRLAQRQLSAQQRAFSMSGSFLPTAWWYTKKSLRSARGSLTTSALFSTGIAVLALKIQLHDAAFLGMSSALLAAASASDIRGLCRITRPAEIAGLKGVLSFSLHYITNQLLVCVALCPSMIAILILVSSGQIYTLLQVVLGVTAGALAGTCVVSRAGSTSSQCLAVMIAVFLTLLPTRLATTDITTAHYNLMITTIIAFAVLSAVIEYIRNPFLWRKNNVPENT